MPIRTIDTVAALKPWLPSDYSATGWDDAAIQQALTDGNDPRLIAAEVWEEYALQLPTDTDGSDKTVAKWTNLDVSVEYGTSRSPREHALRQAQFHRARARVQSIRLKHTLLEGDPPDLPEKGA